MDERAAGGDPALRFEEEQYAESLRTFYRSAGGDEHSDRPEFGSVMRAEHRVVAPVDLDRPHGAPSGPDHLGERAEITT